MRLLLALMLLPVLTFGATVTPGPWTLYRGSTIVQPRVDYPSEAACVAAADKLAPRIYTCRTITTVDVTEAPPPPPPPVVDTWVHASAEGRDFTLYAPAKVRFGVDTRWITKDYPAGLVQCRFNVIGDPAPGVTKTCQVFPGSALQATPSPPPPPAVGTASLAWSAPTRYTDGSTLSAGDVAAYRIYRGTSASNLQQIGEVAGSVRTFNLQGLASGTHYFAVSAVVAGVEGAMSSVVSKAIP